MAGSKKGCKRKRLIKCFLCGRKVWMSHRRRARNEPCFRCRNDMEWPDWTPDPETIQYF